MNKVTKSFIKLQDIVEMIQTLPSGEKVKVIWTTVRSNQWLPTYSTTSSFPFCPNDGQFKKCEDCAAYSEDKDEMYKECMKMWFAQAITDEEMTSRANACSEDPNCEISYRSYDD